MSIINTSSAYLFSNVTHDGEDEIMFVTTDTSLSHVTMDSSNNATSNMSTQLETLEEDYYNYEYDPYNVPIEELIPVSIVYGITMLVGFVGNLLVIISVAKFKKMQNVTNMFLLSLASADLLLVCVCVPIKCAAFFSYTWRLGAILCKTVHYVQNVSILCSVIHLTVLSLERYYAIMHPIRAKCVSTVTLAKKTIAVIWLLSLAMATPILIGRIHKPVGSENRPAFWCIIQWERPIYRHIYGVYMFLVILAVPLSLMSFAYGSICKRVWVLHYERPLVARHSYRTTRHSRPETLHMEPTPIVLHDLEVKNSRLLRTLNKKSKALVYDSSTRQQVIKMLVAVVILFVICWGPITVNNLLVAFGYLDDLHQGILHPLRIAFFALSYFNSCTNPIVYAFMSKHFRNTFKYTLFLLCRRYAIVHQQTVTKRFSAGETRSMSFQTGTVRTHHVADSRIQNNADRTGNVQVRDVRNGFTRCQPYQHHLRDGACEISAVTHQVT